MKVRLGFAVAAHLEPEILVVDEVLAVGDAEFQKKAIGKMQDVSKNDGRTVLFVSHNMASIQALCNRIIIVENGSVIYDGDVNDGIYFYLNNKSYSKDLGNVDSREGHQKGNIISLDFDYEIDQDIVLNTDSIPIGAKMYINTRIKNLINEKREIYLSITVYDNYGIPITCLSNEFNGGKIMLSSGITEIKYIINEVNFVPGTYYLDIWTQDKYGPMDVIRNAVKFNVVSSDFLGTGKLPSKRKHGNIVTKFSIEQN